MSPFAKSLTMMMSTAIKRAALLSILTAAQGIYAASGDADDRCGHDKAKALYRRALARSNLKDDDAAIQDLEAAAAVAPGDAAIVNELSRLKQRAGERAKKEKAAHSMLCCNMMSSAWRHKGNTICLRLRLTLKIARN